MNRLREAVLLPAKLSANGRSSKQEMRHTWPAEIITSLVGVLLVELSGGLGNRATGTAGANTERGAGRGSPGGADHSRI